MAGNFRHFHTVNNAALERETYIKGGGGCWERDMQRKNEEQRKRSNGDAWMMRKWCVKWGEHEVQARRQSWILWRQIHWSWHYMASLLASPWPKQTNQLTDGTSKLRNVNIKGKIIIFFFSRQRHRLDKRGGGSSTGFFDVFPSVLFSTMKYSSRLDMM